jgi:hypothetical protein
MVVHISNPSYLEVEIWRIKVRGKAWQKCENLSEKVTRAKMAVGVAQKAECLTGKHKVLILCLYPFALGTMGKKIKIK